MPAWLPLHLKLKTITEPYMIKMNLNGNVYLSIKQVETCIPNLQMVEDDGGQIEFVKFFGIIAAFIF